MRVFAIDFDGVICDTALETGISAWRAGRQVWSDWLTEEPAPEDIGKFVRLRPMLETGYQAILLMHMIVSGYTEEKIQMEFETLCDSLIKNEDLKVDDLIELFGTTRDRWIQENPEDWYSRHRFYPNTIVKLTEIILQDAVFILTTKQERFVSALLNSAGLDFPCDRIYGLDTGRSKEDILLELSVRPEFSSASFHFIEDRLKTLLRVEKMQSLKHIRLYLADWGYSRKEDRLLAKKYSRITTWHSDDFLNVT